MTLTPNLSSVLRLHESNLLDESANCPATTALSGLRPYLASADALTAGFPDVPGAQAALQHFLDGLLDPRGLLGAVKRIAQHHRRRQDRCERIGDARARNVRRRTA
jgi:hypothetical protein